MIASLLRELDEIHGMTPETGIQIVSPASLLRRPFDPGWPLLLVPAPTPSSPTGAQTDGGATTETSSVAGPPLAGRAVRASTPAQLLRHLYPADHPLVGLGGGHDTTLAAVTDATLGEGAWLVPALTDERNVASPHGLPWLVARLRAPGGCPWDAEQTHQSLKKFVLEEAYEVYDALDAGSTPGLAEELGDLLLQVVLHAHYAAEEGVFDLADVYRAVVTKIVRRHPHVFGDVVAESADEVLRNWETIKAQERAEREPVPSSDSMPAAFRGLSSSLPALHYAQEMQERAASLGYDWPDIQGVIEKLAEEAQELLDAHDDAHRREEFGDLLFVLVNLGRKLGVDAEGSLRAASSKFARRFRTVERLAEGSGRQLQGMTLEELDELWDEAKRIERAGPRPSTAALAAGNATHDEGDA